MGLAEEEVLIRDDSGLLLDVGETRVPKSQEWTKKLTKTICLALGFLVLGLCVAIPGPTLLDLEDQVKATTFEMMIVFVSRSIGYLLGALLGGVLFDCFDKQLLLFCTLLLSSVATVAIPWSLTLVVMATMFALQGVTMGALDTGGNVFCIQLWGKKNPPFIQTLHFAFGIGAFIAPLLAKPFLSDMSIEYNTTSIVQGNIPVAPFAYEELNHNRTVRSRILAYPDLRQVNNDFLNTLAVKEPPLMDRKLSEPTSLHSMIKKEHNLYVRRDTYEDLHGRWKRQSGGGEDYNGMWKWKRHQSKRGLTQYEPDAQTSALKSGDLTTDGTGIASNTNAHKEAGLDPIGKQLSPNKDSVNDDLKVEDDIKSERLGPNNAKSDSDLETSTKFLTAGNKLNVSEGSKVNYNVTNFENRTKFNTTVSVVDSEITTIETLNPTTTEEKVHKPNAATDNNRKPGTADGKDISKHLDTHKNDLQPDTSVTEEENKDHGKEESNTPDLLENKLNATISPDNETLAGINSSVKITQFSRGTSKDNKSTPASINLQITNTTLDPKTSTEAGGITNIATVLTVTTTTSKLTTPTTTKKATTTTSPQPKTTTTTTATTEVKTTTPTTTAVKTTTPVTTTVKTTKATTKTVKITKTATTMKTTLQPVAKVTTNGSKTTKLDQTSDKSNEITTKPSVRVTTRPSVSISNSTNTTVSVQNTTLSDDKFSTTEVSRKPESAVDTFLKNAIHAVKNISKIQFAYLIIGLALFLIAVVFLVLYCKDKRRLTADKGFDELERFESGVSCAKATLILLLGVFFFCYMGLEVTFGALVTTFAVDFNNWSKEQGAMAAAIFWGSLATGRGLSIFFSRCCGPSVMLVIDLIFMIIGGLVLSIGVHFYDKLLWLGTLILGLGMSSAFPAGISWAEKYFHLSGKSTAVFVIGSAVGQMIIPVVTGYLYEHFGAIVLMYAILVLSIINLVIFILMQCVATNTRSALNVRERNGFLPLEDVDDAEENLEMDDFVHFDKSQTRMRRDTRGGGNTEYHTLISDLEDD